MTALFGAHTEHDDRIHDQARDWLGKSVGCTFGRMEFIKGRYAIAIVGDAAEFEVANQWFTGLVEASRVSACPCIYRDVAQGCALQTAAAATQLLRRTLLRQREPLMERAHFSQSLRLACPVTGMRVDFGDFDLVGFYPQAGNEADPLYDPSNHAPSVSINQASDLYGFAVYVRDMMDRAGLAMGSRGCDADQLAALLDKTRAAWNDMAARTISHFGRNTNPERLCPAHLSDDGRYYVTPHDEAEFGETAKRRHISEMPGIYLERMIDEWHRHFAEGICPHLRHVVRPAICPDTISAPQSAMRP